MKISLSEGTYASGCFLLNFFLNSHIFFGLFLSLRPSALRHCCISPSQNPVMFLHQEIAFWLLCNGIPSLATSSSLGGSICVLSVGWRCVWRFVVSKQASVEANVFAALFWILSATMKQNLILYSETALSCLKTFLTSVTGSSGNSFLSPYVFCLFCLTDFSVCFCFC